MKFSSVAIATLFFFEASSSVTAFCPLKAPVSSTTSLMGYLDDLSEDLKGPTIEESNPNPHEESREYNAMAKDQIDRAGPGSWDSFVEFDEFDGGDGQMGVAGDGNKKLEAFDMTQMVKSKEISAKNAWGTNTGYADTLRAKGVDTSRAQQLENWHNQQEVLARRKEQRFMTEDFDNNQNDDEDWRKLAAFGVERNQDFDLDETFGSVSADVNIEGTIDLVGQMNAGFATHEMNLRNPYMGFADFRAAFTAETSSAFTITPSEGSLRQKEDTLLTVKFKAQQPGAVEGYLVIETEDFKKTWKVVGRTG
mmetsp:Transcript_9438/g.28161  ORF Transcript_9438/g.28161 Transcript_9438/m.28161 type:complete len:308 (+) Transcript_9438:83-1006(+)